MIKEAPKIVLGLGFGDEGKGRTVSYLCSQTEDPIVVRFNGGHQAGHTVVHEGKRHVFSSFGSGTLQGVPTFWSRFCTVCPMSYMEEYRTLLSLGVFPEMYMELGCPVTTPYDVLWNQYQNSIHGHGTVGVGFGATLEREENGYHLLVRDLINHTVFDLKLEQVIGYYRRLLKDVPEHELPNPWSKYELETVEFRHACRQMISTIVDVAIPINRNIIFEGAQGILLDMDHGFFPHVTRSSTTSVNADSIIGHTAVDTYYVTRSYLTRHGNGPLPGETTLTLSGTVNETNQTNDYQGKFRKAPLSVDLFNYALYCDSLSLLKKRSHLVVTCMDQFELDVRGFLSKTLYSELFRSIHTCYGPGLEDVREYGQLTVVK